MASLRQLFDSLSSEQRRNQDLLVSLGFALRSFTNLQRFLELVPVVASRLVGVEGPCLFRFRRMVASGVISCRGFQLSRPRICCSA